MEAGVEAGDVGDMRTEAPQLSHDSKGRPVVKRRQLSHRAEALVHGLIDEDALSELGAPMHQPVANRVDLAGGGDEALKGWSIGRSSVSREFDLRQHAVAVVQQ